MSGSSRQLRIYIFFTIYLYYIFFYHLPKLLDGDNSAQKEKGLLDRAKDYVSTFDEEKEQVLKHADKFIMGVEVVAFVGSAGKILSKYCLDPETTTSACVV